MSDKALLDLDRRTQELINSDPEAAELITLLTESRVLFEILLGGRGLDQELIERHIQSVNDALGLPA